MKPFSNVQSVLVVLSSRGLSFDMPSLRSLISHAYPGAAVFFISTNGDAVGVEGPNRVDLVIDLTEPGAFQSMFFAPKMRSRGSKVVGRNAGWFFRRSKYDRVYDEKADLDRPKDFLDSERWAQRKVLELAGVPVIRQGGVTQDRSKDIALELPPMRQR
jgi:hypothetical protein